MMKEIILLEQYILNAPASQAEHQQALQWLKSIMEAYERQVQQARESSQKG